MKKFIAGLLAGALLVIVCLLIAQGPTCASCGSDVHADWAIEQGADSGMITSCEHCVSRD